MDFRTKVNVTPSKDKIQYTKPVLCLGSCFADNMGSKLAYFKFPVLHNPFGVLYNPYSIVESLKIILQNRQFTVADLHHHNGLWFSLNHHSSFSGTDKHRVLSQINNKIEQVNKFIHQIRFLSITFGTAWIYQLKETNQIVANCHKLPDNRFIRTRLSVQHIVDSYRAIIEQIGEINPYVQFIFTVSPIRHWKDGPVENQMSKSCLVLAVHELVSLFNHSSYFPAYEIMMDELRDYRFYASDMLHPSEVAIEYIWNIFRHTYLDEADYTLMKRILKIQQGVNHKPSKKESPQYQKFLKTMIQEIESLEASNINVDLAQERLFFQQRLR